MNELCMWDTNQIDCKKYDARRRLVTETYFLTILRQDLRRENRNTAKIEFIDNIKESA